MLSKRNLKDYNKQIVKVNFRNDSGYVVGKLRYTKPTKTEHFDPATGPATTTTTPCKYAILINNVALEISLGVIKDFCVINYDALEKSQRLANKANGRKLNGNGKIKRILRNSSSRNSRKS